MKSKLPTSKSQPSSPDGLACSEVLDIGQTSADIPTLPEPVATCRFDLAGAVPSALFVKRVPINFARTKQVLG
ncbi:MAG: hypothetical protein EHM48_03530, partial [Planctomycetaceae bacterium]